MYSAWRESTQRSLITESCRLSGVGSLVKDLLTKDLRAGAKTKHSQTKSISDSEAAGHTDSLNAHGETLSPYPKTVILKKMSWGNVVEWCVNRLKL
jgi:hypothetical protein